jgi:tetratricopeptide (TPR) repeat protein
MSYEIAWTRLLSRQLGSSTYAFTLMLGTFLTGIVGGSASFERWGRRRAPGAMTFAVTQTLTALGAQLAEILRAEEKPDEATRAMLDALAADPYNYKAHLDLGELLARQKKWAEARTHLEFVMRYFPDEDSGVYPLLYQADQALGDPRAAAKAIRFVMRVFPDNAEQRRLNSVQ